MKILGIDFGTKKIGMAIATTPLAEVYGVIRFKKVEEALNMIKKVVEEENIEKIVIGLSEGETAKKTKDFGKKLEERSSLPVIFQDETLSTKDAQRLSIEAGVNRKKRQQLEDAYSAALILQSYIDSIEK